MTPPATVGEIIDGIVERIWDAGAQAGVSVQERRSGEVRRDG